MHRISGIFHGKTARYVMLALLVAVVGGYWYAHRSGGAAPDTLVVRKGDFIQEVSISGKVVAAQAVELGFSQSGRVSYAPVAVGSRVAAGTVLAEIENGDLRALVLQKQAALESQEAKLRSLQSGTRPEDVALAQSTVDGDIAALNQANQGLVNAISDAYLKADDAVRLKVDAFIYDPQSSSPRLLFITSDFRHTAAVQAKRVEVEQALTAWQRDVALLAADGDLVTALAHARVYLAAVADLLAAASEALADGFETSTYSQSQIDASKVDIAAARASISTAIVAVNTAQTTQKSAAASLDTARKNLALKQAPAVSTDLDAQLSQVKAARADLDQAQSQLAKTRITAPFAGIITAMDAKVGGIAAPNEPEISMISEGTFQIEVYVPEVEITGFAVGDKATTTLDAYGASVPFAATVVSIDPAETVRDGVSTYKTTLQFDRNDPRIKSGMTASVIITGTHIPDALAVPRGAIFTKGTSQQYVQVLRGERTVDVAVMTGDTSTIGNVQIVSGLADGDVVVLNPSQ